MVGCRDGAKNTLVKNYLWLAERLGAHIEPLRTVTDVRPLDPAHPEHGYAVTTERTGAWVRRDRQVTTAGQVVVAAGPWGTARLLQSLKVRGVLPELSDRLGDLTRTNSEALGGAMAMKVPPGVDLTRGVAITTSFHVDEVTHVENCRYGKGSNLMGGLASLLVDDAPGDARPRRWWRRPARFVAQAVREPREFASTLSVRRWSERTVIALVMQSLDNSLTVRGRRRRFGGVALTSTQGHGTPNPTWFPQATAGVQAMTRALTRATGTRAVAGGNISAIVDMPLTAHFLGGCPISDDPDGGVVDPYHRVWGYPGIHVVDGSAISANLGVNPSLTITAQAERALSLWPRRGQSDRRPPQGQPYQRVDRPVSA
jgi:cholesterol oxidase